ncbi:uncharacterized protein PAC_18660 [Phialocephala subalpina]|uniref:FAD-binding domain-containing protein n=1 Tax=Phialocephala subalpina TaxID=576137 RepID=A0A1L7XUS0_9HELO|nr:uncharacterized protein PAC_18660 [Phialocephala subalpina]
MSEVIEVPVVIVGGGSCGLNLSIFLSDLAVDHVLLERHPSTSHAPKAHIINQRTMEIFRQHGIADPIVEQGTPPRQMSQVVWQTSLGGDGPLDRKVLAAIDTWGCKAGTERNTTYLRDAPLLPSNLPLLRSEPIFRAIAEQKNPGKVLFGHTVTDFTDQGDSVIVHVQTKDDKQITYRAQYVVGADGGKTVGPKLGIEMDGPTKLRQVTSVHFKADVSEYWDDRTCITNFASVESGPGFQSGSMLPLGPSWGRHSEEWQMHFSVPVGVEALSKEAAIIRVRELLKLPDLEMEITSCTNWILERVLARSYQKGRVFLGGDATHRHPPTTGLGLNTAVQDAHNLAWKLAYVLKGKASPQVLNTYETERRHIGRRNCDWAFFTSKRRLVISAAMGLQEGQTAANTIHLTQLLDETSEIGKAGLAVLQEAVEGQKVEFGAHNMDLGFSYLEGLFVPDGSEPPREDPTQQVYTPTTRPGHRLPHAWIEFRGKFLSTHDLLGTNGDFLLITDRHGKPWVEQAREVAEERGIGLRIAHIVAPYQGAKEGEYVDSDAHWMEVRGFKDGGAILVRPDSVVGWRSLGRANPGNLDISSAFDTLLGNSSSRTLLNGISSRTSH